MLLIAACSIADSSLDHSENKKQANQIVVQKPLQEPQFYYRPLSFYPQYISPEQYTSQYYTYRAPIYTPAGPIYTPPIVKSSYTYPFHTLPSVSSSPLVNYDYKPLVTVESH